jgi:signal transduction histidine kinase/CheY-like chemotaxis protein
MSAFSWPTPPSTFRARIFWSLIPIILSLFILVGILDLYQNKRMAEDAFLKRGRAMAVNLAYSGELGVFAEDKHLLESSVRSVIGEADVAYVFIHGDQWKILANGGRLIGNLKNLRSELSGDDIQLISGLQPFSKSAAVGGQEFVEFFAPIVSQAVGLPEEHLLESPRVEQIRAPQARPRVIGAVRLGLSYHTVNEHMAALLKLWGGLTVVFLGLSTLAIYAFSKRITRPVIQLTQQANKIAHGFLDQVIPVNSRDEIGQLGATFNEMAQSLKKNVSEKERVLEELRELNATLEERIRTRTAEVEAINEQLREATRHKSEFLANMSHELRTPLNAVLGFSEVLLERMFGDLNPKQEEYLQDILESGRHLLSLINDILDLSKIEAGRMEPELATFDLPMALQNGLMLVEERANRHGIQVTLKIDETLGDFTGDERKIKQILLNLLSNAIKFTPDGGRISVNAAKSENLVEISVSDTGIGIAPEDQRRIFEEFRQAGGDSARKGEGTGLGLTLAKKFVELHGGKIWVESVVGQGSTFTFSLPLREPLLADSAAAPNLTPSPETQLVLVIEDDPLSAKLLSTHLSEEGYRVEFAHDGETAFNKALALHPAVITLDIMLPKVDGWDLLSRLKRNAETRDIPIIVVSIIDERGKGFALGAADYLVKPVQREALVAAIKRFSIPAKLNCEAVKVLAIDDDPMALELIAGILGSEGYQVIKASNGKEGIELAKTELPELIILDLLMPEFDGFAVLDKICGDEMIKETPIVILTNKDLTAEEKKQLIGRISFLAQKQAFTRKSLVDLVHRLTLSSPGVKANPRS